ncbi:hypothetical protein [Dechloromonas sp. A34]|uniref:hypothetical protein n=1 Tax=Dechloromonas sp. A34 TaxID=447588 RepID=UPI002249501B|nr:hypothetical protein [Dechloromonas sp. A34]
MPSPSHSDVTLIVRECGERTADACVGLLEEMFPRQIVFRVSGQPFAATLEKSLLQGLAEARPWTLCIDADVLVLPSLIDFIDEAKRLPDHYVEAQALVADKLLPARRPAGNHLYRTALIPKALSCLPKGASLRPESSMMDYLGQAGHPYHQSGILVGLHDFAQFPADIYSKAALHGHKHAYLEELLLPLWQEWAQEDPDYRIAYDAFVASRQSPHPQPSPEIHHTTFPLQPGRPFQNLGACQQSTFSQCCVVPPTSARKLLHCVIALRTTLLD